MFFEMKNLFGNKRKNKTVLESMKVISESTDFINREVERLDTYEFDSLKDNGNEYFISFSDFLYFVESEDVSLTSILKRFKHIGELSNEKFSCVDVYATAREEGVLLTTEPLLDCKSDKIQVVSVRKKR